MLIFPLVYASSFIYSFRRVLSGDHASLLLFFVFGLPIYITSLTVLHLLGMDSLIPLFQYSKELIVLVSLGMLVFRLDAMPKLNILDRLVLLYLVWIAAYVVIPLGSFGLYEKLVAFKNIAFFPFVYFIGRLMDPKQLWLSKYQVFIMVLAIAAGAVLLTEVIRDQHLQTGTGYAAYYQRFFSVDPTGNHGLSWTFEIEGGIKRFASFFANPLEHAAATLLTVAVLVAMLSKREIKQPVLFYLASIASILSVVFALSRASMAGYILASYLFFLITGNKKILMIYHGLLLAIVGIFLYFLANDTIGDFFLNTIDFSNSSSLSHLIEWVDGIEAIGINPMGMGLGESGRVAGELGVNVGGENQLIITGVQSGLVAVGLYIAIYVVVIKWAAQFFLHETGNKKQLGIMLFILKTGLIVPVMTAAVESYLYVSFVGWFLVGVMSALKNASTPGIPFRKLDC